MLTIQIIDTETGVSAIAEIPGAHAPAFRSAVTEQRNELGERLAGAHNYGKEDALTKAASAFGIFAGALNRVVLTEDRDYA
jgi:hypothetical protein